MNTNDPMTRERLDAIQERVDKATGGPWRPGERCIFVDAPDSPDENYAVVSDEVVNGIHSVGISREADAEFIAHAREDIPALLAEVERLRALLTVDEEMVERGVRAHRETFNAWPVKRNLEDAGNRRVAAMRAALDAALGTGEEA